MAISTVELALNGQTITIPLDTTSGKYKKTITAPTKSSRNMTGGVYPMVLKIKDQAGNITTVDGTNATYGAQMKLQVVEKVKPVITVTSPSEGAYLTNSQVTLSVDITDDDSGVDPNSIVVKLGEVVQTVTKTAITNGYRCTATLTIPDGARTITVTASDKDGNAADAVARKFTVDTVPPTLNVSYPGATTLITNQQICTVTGTTNDATSGPATVTIKLGSVDQGAITVSAEGSFSKAITLAKGSNTIVVTARDKAGKTSTVNRTVIYDPDAPRIISINVTPNPVDAGSNFTITVEATD